MKTPLILLVFSTLLIAPTIYADDKPCGETGITCGEEERCCEHIMATFYDDGGGQSYVNGRCIPKNQKCGDYWCGNRQCQAGLFGTPSVCCVSEQAGVPQSYKCAYSEYSCPGNTQQLSIRTDLPDRKLQGS
jgi:hypothetical protein